jgi:hypothetical protein
MTETAQSSNRSYCGHPFALAVLGQSQEIVGMLISAVAAVGSRQPRDANAHRHQRAFGQRKGFSWAGRIATRERVSGRPMPEHV